MEKLNEKKELIKRRQMKCKVPFKTFFIKYYKVAESCQSKVEGENLLPSCLTSKPKVKC